MSAPLVSPSARCLCAVNTLHHGVQRPGGSTAWVGVEVEVGTCTQSLRQQRPWDFPEAAERGSQ